MPISNPKHANNGSHTSLSRQLIFLCLLSVLSISTTGWAQNHKIAIFGSSVANGSGDTTGLGGYAGLIASMLEKRGWEVLNISRGGDNTGKILPRFESQLLPQKPKYVILGLSLGNEGIATSSELARNRSFEKYRSGMQRLVRLCQENEMYPVVVNCYARNDFKEEQYIATKKMNLIINTWEVPSVNVLGPIDNGEGNWLPGYYHDKSHPNCMGHQEMFYAFVPSLFDAMESGKPVPQKIRYSGYLSIKQPASPKPLTYTPDDEVHSFAVSFQVKAVDNGTIAVIRGTKSSYLEINKGKIEYHSLNGQVLSCDTMTENKGWQYIVVTHQYATGLTSFYSNGKLAGNLIESLDLKEFVLGGNASESPTPAPGKASYRDLLIYRSVLNCDEATALYYDQLLQSSMEIYAPLNDAEFKPGNSPANYAQSLSRIILNGDSLTHEDK